MLRDRIAVDASRRLLFGCLALALGSAGTFLLTSVPVGSPALGAAVALLATGLLVAGTLAIGTSAPHRPA